MYLKEVKFRLDFLQKLFEITLDHLEIRHIK